MDQSRQADLKHLDQRLADPNFKGSLRTAAEKTRGEIIAQSKDKKLAALRARLIRANRAHDAVAVKQIEAKIKHHKKEHFDDYDPDYKYADEA